jgi:F0F1-type ATP synthase membrane subunit b/b'
MINRISLMALTMASLLGALAAGTAVAQAALQSPVQVKTALGTLNRVVDHTDRLIKAKNYTHLVHENEEFKEGAEALESATKTENAEFRAHLQPLLSKAEADSQHVADAATAHDDAMLVSTHAAFADSVKAVLADFPAGVQPRAPSLTHEQKEDKKN